MFREVMSLIQNNRNDSLKSTTSHFNDSVLSNMTFYNEGYPEKREKQRYFILKQKKRYINKEAEKC
jgi:hypothetical protein